MAIRLFDSLSREIRELKPGSPDGIFRFYNCGPTVYAPAHIGNFRTFIVNDVIRRLLELEFGKDKVKHVRNITDVDDKTIKRSRDEGRPLGDVTKQWTAKFHADCDALNCLRPHVEPTATTHIAEQIKMISSLEGSGNAYRAADGSVYFKVGSFAGYGALSRVKERELKPASAFAADDDEKEDLSDFALWKAHKPEDGDVGWESPWGRGRPGWHIECSAMSKKHLGDTIDLHTGGVDLLFPHHENEIAQSECCNGVQFARHWYHGEHLLVDGKKMSKSLGNMYTLEDLVRMRIYPTAVRLALLSAHPRKQLNFTLDGAFGAGTRLSGLSHAYDLLKIVARKSGRTRTGTLSQRFNGVIESLSDDLNFPAALAALSEGLQSTGIYSAEDFPAFEKALRVLGLQVHSSAELTMEDDHVAIDVAIISGLPKAVAVPSNITALAEKRWAAKQAKDFKAADALRADLTAAGWSMLDRKDGYSLKRTQTWITGLTQ